MAYLIRAAGAVVVLRAVSRAAEQPRPAARARLPLRGGAAGEGCAVYYIVRRLNLMMGDEAVRLIAPTLSALLVLGNVACSDMSGRNPSNRESAQTNSEQWQPGSTMPGASRRDLVGDPRRPGPFKYQLKVPAGSRVAAHRHSIAVRVRVLSGSMFIIIGEPLASPRAQRFTAGSAFVVPAHTRHDEWWEEEAVVEAEGVGPMETIYESQ